MTDAVAAAWIALLPTVLVLLLVVVVAAVNRERLAGLLDRVSKLSVAGVLDVELATETLATARKDRELSESETDRVRRRAEQLLPRLRSVRVLWVDDAPAGNAAERRFLRAAGVTVVNALSTDEALALLARDEFDVVITDIDRPESQRAGPELARTLAGARHPVPVIGYVGTADRTLGAPAGMRAVTDRPDELMHQVFDVVERLG